MAKTIMKQVIITLLTCTAVGLVFLVIIYQGVLQQNRVIPAKVTPYTTPANVTAEIAEDVTEQEFEAKNEVYEITDVDLDKYKRTQSYNPGKSDPFAAYTTNSVSSNEVSENNGGQVSTQTNTVDTNTTNNYYTAANINKDTK